MFRFLAVAAVVYYHAYHSEPGAFILAPQQAHSFEGFVEGFVSQALMRWGLPLLAVISGFLFFRTLTPTAHGFLTKMRTRVRTIVIPFLIWSGLGVLFAIAVAHSPARDVSPYWTITSAGEALHRWLVDPVIYPLWFLQALMTCVVLSPLVYLLVRGLRSWALVVAVVWWSLGWQPADLMPWISATIFPAFIAGAVFALRGWRWPWEGRRAAAAAGPPAAASASPAVTWTLVAAWLVAAALFTVYGHLLGSWTRAVLLVVVVLSVFALWTAFDALRGLLRPSPRLVTTGLFVASLSFFVYVTQEPTLSVLKHIGEKVVPASADGGSAAGQALAVIVYLAAPTITIALSVVAAIVLGELLPRVYRVTTGGRGPRRTSAHSETVT